MIRAKNADGSYVMKTEELNQLIKCVLAVNSEDPVANGATPLDEWKQKSGTSADVIDGAQTVVTITDSTAIVFSRDILESIRSDSPHVFYRMMAENLVSKLYFMNTLGRLRKQGYVHDRIIRLTKEVRDLVPLLCTDKEDGLCLIDIYWTAENLISLLDVSDIRRIREAVKALEDHEMARFEFFDKTDHAPRNNPKNPFTVEARLNYRISIKSSIKSEVGRLNPREMKSKNSSQPPNR